MDCEFCNGATWVVVVTARGLHKQPCILCAAKKHRHIASEFKKLNELMGDGMHPDTVHFEVACALEALAKTTTLVKKLDVGLGITAMACGAPSIKDRDKYTDGGAISIEEYDEDEGNGEQHKSKETMEELGEVDKKKEIFNRCRDRDDWPSQ